MTRPQQVLTLHWRQRMFETINEVSGNDPDLINPGSRALITGLLPAVDATRFEVLWEAVCQRQTEVHLLDGYPDDLAVSRERLESEIQHLMDEGSVV